MAGYSQGIKWMLVKPYRLCFFVAAFSLFIGLFQIQNSYAAKNYMQTVGEVCNVKSKRVFRRQGYVTRYSYDLIWSMDGETHNKHFGNQVNIPEEGKQTIWVRKDGKDAGLASSGKSIDTWLYLVVSFVAGLLAVILYYYHVKRRNETREQRLERLEDRQLYSMIAFVLCIFAVVITVMDMRTEYRERMFVPFALYDLLVISVLSGVICLIVFFFTKKQIKSMK